RVDHRAVLRDAVEIQARAAPTILEAELTGDDAAHRVAEDAEAHEIEARGELSGGALRRQARQTIQYESRVVHPAPERGVSVLQRGQISAQPFDLLAFVRLTSDCRHGLLFLSPFGEDLAD